MVDILSEIITCIVLKREKVEPRNMVIVKRDTIMRIIRRRLSEIYNEFNNRCRRVNWIGYNIIIFFFFFIVETKRWRSIVRFAWNPSPLRFTLIGTTLFYLIFTFLNHQQFSTIIIYVQSIQTPLLQRRDTTFMYDVSFFSSREWIAVKSTGTNSILLIKIISLNEDKRTRYVNDHVKIFPRKLSHRNNLYFSDSLSRSNG